MSIRLCAEIAQIFLCVTYRLSKEDVTEILIGLCPFPIYIEYEEIAASMKTSLLSHQYTPLWCHNKDMQAGTTVSSGTQPIAGM